MGRKEELEKEIEILEAEIKKAKLQKELANLKPTEKDEIPSNINSNERFSVDGIEFTKVSDKEYIVHGSSGQYKIIEAKRTHDHLYCNCPQMTYRGFSTNQPCKHEKALAKKLGLRFDGYKMVK